MLEKKKRKVTPQEWEAAIRKARQYTAGYHRARWIIADLALSVCDVSLGGRKGPTVYSIRRFADEIEIDSKTLYQWIRVKRLVLDKLPKMVQKNAHKYLYQDFDAVCELVKKDTSPREVRDIWMTHLKTDPDTKKFKKYSAHLNALLYNAQRPIMMREVSADLINEMIKKCDLISSLLRKELQFRERYPNKTMSDAKRLNMKDELAKRLAQESGE